MMARANMSLQDMIVMEIYSGNFCSWGTCFLRRRNWTTWVSNCHGRCNRRGTEYLGVMGYEWGCYGTEVDGADGITIGTGYQNTMDIINQACVTDLGGITAAQASRFRVKWFDDWYLPSRDELIDYLLFMGALHGTMTRLI